MIGVPALNLADVSIAGFVLNTIDVNGCAWILTDIDGWWNLPPVDLPDDPKPYQYDGSYTTDGRFLARTLTLTGYVEPGAGGRTAIATSRRNFLSALALVRSSGLLVVNEPDAAKSALVRLSDQPQIAPVNSSNQMTFQISLVASDPRKYSAAVTVLTAALPTAGVGRTYNRTYTLTYGALGSTGFVTPNNLGDYATGATIDFLGPVTNPAVEHIESGSRLAFNITLSNTDTLTVDLMSHTVRLNGTASRRSSLSFNSTWFTLQPGINTLRFTGTAGTVDPRTAMNVTYQSAWIE